jgi:predicted membrane-bound spermidine synthase
VIPGPPGYKQTDETIGNPGRGLVWGVLFSIPLWGLIIAAVFNVVIGMVLYAFAIVALACMLPQRRHLLSKIMFLTALTLIVLGVAATLHRWF